jgi:uncharacterized protein involved in exopolysaccharide biosynthesis
MRRILKLLARFYPAAWRSRYGAEYEALIEDAQPRASDGFDVAWGAAKMWVTSWSFVRIVLPCALAGTLLALGISLVRPAIYHSRTLITVNSDSRVSIDNELAEQVRGALATPFLEELIQKDNLYPKERTRMPMGDVVNLMRKDIWLRSLQKSDGKPAMAFVVEFSYPDAHVAQRVDEELVSQLVAENLSAAINNASATADFLKEQLAAASDPAIKARIQSQLLQAEAASRFHETFRVLDPANLPKTPEGWGRAGFGVVGALGGLLAGLIAAAVVGRRSPAAIER